MFQFLNQPYPIDHSPASQFRKAIGIGLFIGLFLLVFQPFGMNLWETTDKTLKILGFGLVTFVITVFNFIILRRLLPTLFREHEWTVGREIIALMVNILLIAIGNRLYLDWLLEPVESSGISWAGMILGTFLIGLFPVTALVSLSYITQLKKYSQAVTQIPIPIHTDTSRVAENTFSEQPKKDTDTMVTLVAENEKDTVRLYTDDLLFIESSDNYCTIAYLKNGQIAKPLLRSSLSRLEKQLVQPHIVRCHRSYIVNLDRVERVTGNAQGYKLHVLSGQFIVPVSRQYNDTLVARLKAL